MCVAARFYFDVNGDDLEEAKTAAAERASGMLDTISQSVGCELYRDDSQPPEVVDDQGEICDECGESIADSEPAMVNTSHGEACSLNPKNVEG